MSKLKALRDHNAAMLKCRDIPQSNLVKFKVVTSLGVIPRYTSLKINLQGILK